MFRKSILAYPILLCALIAGQARAAAPADSLPAAKSRLHSARGPVEVDPNMTEKAYLWGLGATFGPILAAAAIAQSPFGTDAAQFVIGSLVVSGAIVGPSVGQFYAHAPGAAGLGIGIRSGGAVLTVIGAAVTLSDAFCGWGDSEEDNRCSDHGGPVIAVIGLLTYAGGVAYSFADTYHAVNRYREKANDYEFSLSPVLGPDRKGNIRAGAMACLRF